jgi:hypothetical protein
LEATFSTIALPSPRWVTGDDVAVEGGVGDLSVDPLGGEDPVRGEITERGVVLVEGVDDDAVRGGAGGIGKGFAEFDLTVVGDTDPVDGAEDDRLFGANQDDPAAAQGMGDALGGIVSERAADGWGGIDGEDSDLKRLGDGRWDHRKCQEHGEHWQVSAHVKGPGGSRRTLNWITRDTGGARRRDGGDVCLTMTDVELREVSGAWRTPGSGLVERVLYISPADDG